MKFNITGKYIQKITIERTYFLEDAEIEVSKKNVLKTLQLPAVVDGDPTHWYEEVEEALKNGCSFKKGSWPLHEASYSEKIHEQNEDWEIVDISYN